MNLPLDIEFERAIRLLVEHLPPAEEGTRKAVLPHILRVGARLYRDGYGRDIVLGGLLHDSLEWSGLGAGTIEAAFGRRVLEIVRANSKNRSIADPDERIAEMIGRCVATGEDALIVKAADTIDSFEHYTRVGNQEELSNHCAKNARAILNQLPREFSDPIFEELKGWLNKNDEPGTIPN